MDTQNFKNLIKANETVAVALSGGLDSTCLFFVLLSLQKELSFKLKVINVDHQIRQNSSSDSLFCKTLAEKYNIEIKSYKVDALNYSKQNSLSLEDGARRLRYDCFFNALNERFCDKVAVAHHQSDLAETILFNLFRGSGVKGISALTETAYGGKIIRPFLNIDKSEILSYAKENNIAFVEDETNLDTTYSRNYLRKNVMPIIKNRFPEFEKALSRFSQTCYEDDEFINNLAIKEIEFSENPKIPVGLNKPVFARAVINILKYLGVEKDYTKNRIDCAFELNNMQTGKQIELLKGIKAVREYNKIVFYKNNDLNNNIYEKFNLGEININNKIINIKKVDKLIKNNLCFDFDKIPKTAIIRKINNLDYFVKFGKNQKIDLIKYLSSKKISAENRKNLIVVANENEILIICGVEISNNIKIDENTKNICTITIN